MPKLLLPIIFSAMLAAGCSANLSMPGAETPTTFIITSTLPATIPPPPTHTALPPTPVPTAAPLEGTTTTQLNVRTDPSSAGATLGMIVPFTKVQVVGKDPGGNWYQLIYPQAPDGKGWVSAQYVQINNKDAVPVIGGSSASDSGTSGVITQQVNVRSGPDTTFDSVGTLNQNDAVTLTGKDSSGQWLQIAFKSAPNGKGWVSAGYVQVHGTENLPIVAQTGSVIGTGTPTGVPPTITPTLIAAIQDGDSAASPAMNVTFSPSGTRSLIYSSDVSTPDGDAEDWIRFTPFSPTVSASLACTGNGTLGVEVLQNGAALQDWSGLACGKQNQMINVQAGQAYLVHLKALPVQNTLGYVKYTLTIGSNP